MPGSVTYEPEPVPLGRQSAVVGVFRYDPLGASGEKFELLPNVRCLDVQFREGYEVPTARFRYVFGDPLADPGDPQRVEAVYPLDAQGQGVVQTDDRLCVYAFDEGGTPALLFDGFVLTPAAHLGPDAETVTFAASATPVREWDGPLPGAVVRDADDPTAMVDTRTALPARFNPNGYPNASPTNLDAGTAPNTYPVFLGPFWPKNAVNGYTVRAWTLPLAARYVIVRGRAESAAVAGPATYVDAGDLSYLDNELRSLRPSDENDTGVIDLTDPSTYEYDDIIVPEIDVTGVAWPEALNRLLDPHGFGFRWILEEGDVDADTGLPEPHWRFLCYRKDTAGFQKSLKLQPAGNALDPARTNVGGVSLERGHTEIVNRVVVDTGPVLYEASFALAPLFTIDPADAVTATGLTAPWRRSAENAAAALPDSYRKFGVDECGEGHWDISIGAHGGTSEAVPDLGSVLDVKGSQVRPYAVRRRPPRRDLLETDDKGRPLHAELDVTLDVYTSPIPGVFDGKSGPTWQPLVSGWKLLEDRLGIEVTVDDPNAWPVPADAAAPAWAGGQTLHLVEWSAQPTSSPTGQPPTLRLTCVIEGDRDLGVKAERRDASPTEFIITRRVDARDRYRKAVVSGYSAYSTPVQGEDAVVDDTKEAQGYADGIRRSREAGVFAGSVTVPRLTPAYRVGDRVTRVDGRDVSLRMNAADAAQESPVYPTVVAVSYELDGKQVTTLELSDRRAEPNPPRRRKAVPVEALTGEGFS